MKFKSNKRDNTFIALGLVTTLYLFLIIVVKARSIFEMFLWLGCTLLLDVFILFVDRMQNSVSDSKNTLDLDTVQSECEHDEYIKTKYHNELEDLSQALNLGWVSTSEYEHKVNAIYARDN